MKFQVNNCSDGERIDAQADLDHSEVELLTRDVVAVVHDEDAEQVTWERTTERSERPREGEIAIPDDAVAVDMSQGYIIYFSQVNE